METSMEISMSLHGDLHEPPWSLHGPPTSMEPPRTSMEPPLTSMEVSTDLHGASTDLHGGLRRPPWSLHGPPWRSPPTSMELRGGLHGVPDNVGRRLCYWSFLFFIYILFMLSLELCGCSSDIFPVQQTTYQIVNQLYYWVWLRPDRLICMKNTAHCSSVVIRL